MAAAWSREAITAHLRPRLHEDRKGFSPESIFSATWTQVSCAAAGKSEESAVRAVSLNTAALRPPATPSCCHQQVCSETLRLRRGPPSAICRGGDRRWSLPLNHPQRPLS